MVRLRLRLAYAKRFLLSGFNPTMVRLRLATALEAVLADRVSIPLWCDCDLRGCGVGHVLPPVSIPLWCDCDLKEDHYCYILCPRVSIPLWCDCDYEIRMPFKFGFGFNPTMVRLRRTHFLLFSDRLHSFQSHYGAIATTGLPIGYGNGGEFQSHYGAIATSGKCPPSHVRGRFQSHYGAIATLFVHHRQPKPSQFQSHYGAIATLYGPRHRQGRCLVSIPLWCDCDLDSAGRGIRPNS
mgnify:CR=1 FL=1